MNLAKMTILASAFSITSVILFTSLYMSDDHVPFLVLHLSLAMAFVAVIVMYILVKAQKRQLEQMKRPFGFGAITFALAGVSGASRTMVLGLLTGAWEYWAMMMNLLFFVASVMLLWYKKFIERLLQDVKQK
ncbi:hypothetical protein JW998_17175 [candidate division KSB1 bacterium]|nr:hypothetical protein [candidate division KSB1 bacterium]